MLTETGQLKLEGACFPENALAFFEPIIGWIHEYGREIRGPLKLDVHLDYFNTSSSKCLMDLFAALEDYMREGHPVEVRWFYLEDDEDMFESGQEFAEDLELTFDFIAQ
jgi:hypothetical protein